MRRGCSTSWLAVRPFAQKSCQLCGFCLSAEILRMRLSETVTSMPHAARQYRQKVCTVRVSAVDVAPVSAAGAGAVVMRPSCPTPLTSPGDLGAFSFGQRRFPLTNRRATPGSWPSTRRGGPAVRRGCRARRSCPASMTRMTSASRIVERRCAMMKLVRSRRSSAVASWISSSVRVSTELVASSRISSRGWARIALAMVISCFSPALTLPPSSLTQVW